MLPDPGKVRSLGNTQAAQCLHEEDYCDICSQVPSSQRQMLGFHHWFYPWHHWVLSPWEGAGWFLPGTGCPFPLLRCGLVASHIQACHSVVLFCIVTAYHRGNCTHPCPQQDWTMGAYIGFSPENREGDKVHTWESRLERQVVSPDSATSSLILFSISLFLYLTIYLLICLFICF